MVKLERKMLGAHMGPVMAAAPAFGTINKVPDSFAALAMAIATPLCTVPTITSTLSRLMSLLTLSVALDGSLSSSTRTNSTSRPAIFPPCSATYKRKPLSMAVPKEAKVPVAGSMKPTLSLGCACAHVLVVAAITAKAAAESRTVLFCMVVSWFFSKVARWVKVEPGRNSHRLV